MNDKTLVCPICDCDNLFVTTETTYNLNSGEFYCHSVKAFDGCAKVACRNKYCNWVGTLAEVKGGA